MVGGTVKRIIGIVALLAVLGAPVQAAGWTVQVNCHIEEHGSTVDARPWRGTATVDGFVVWSGLAFNEQSARDKCLRGGERHRPPDGAPVVVVFPDDIVTQE